MEGIKKLETGGESAESGIFTLGKLDKGGLPEDLLNTISATDSYLALRDDGECSEEQVRNVLIDTSKTFDEYVKEQVKRHNDSALKHGMPLFDADASVEAERKRIAPELIDEFDEKILKLHKLAGAEKPNWGLIKKIIREKIIPLIRGKEK